MLVLPLRSSVVSSHLWNGSFLSLHPFSLPPRSHIRTTFSSLSLSSANRLRSSTRARALPPLFDSPAFSKFQGAPLLPPSYQTTSMSLVSSLASLLEQSASSDASVAEVATKSLKTDHKTSESIPAFFEILATSTNLDVRNLAAVELRRRILLRDGALWKKLAEESRAQIKQVAFELIESSTATLRVSISRVISSIAVNELDPSSSSPSSWSALLPFVYSLASSPTTRVTGITLINYLLDDVPDLLQAEFQAILEVLKAGLSDAESQEARILSLTGLGKIAEYLDLEDAKDVSFLEKLVPAMVSVLRETMELGDKDGLTRQAFDDFETIIISETPLVGTHVTDLVDFFLGGGENMNYEISVRVMSLNALLWIVRCHHKIIELLNLADSIVARLLPIGREDTSENDEDTPAGLAFRVLDVLSQILTPAQIFPALHRHIQSDMGSTDPSARKSALLALGYTVEGCSEFIQPHVAQLWPIVDAGLQDQDASVKRAACIALGCLTESLPDEVALRHDFIVPALFNLIAEPSTQKAASAALDSYLEILGDSITNYLPLLMERLLVLLDNAPLPVRSTIVGAIGSAAHAADKDFVPYFEATVARIQPFLQLQAEGEERQLRGIATDTLGTIAEAVGKDLFRPLMQSTLKVAFEALELDDSKLRESSFMYFATIASLFTEEFVPFLPNAMEALVTACERAETEDDLLASTEAVEEDDDDDFEDLEEEEGKLEQLLGAHNAAITIEKEIAADVIGDLFAATGRAFLPYVERSVKVLVVLLDHYYAGIRKSALTSLFTFMSTFYDLSEPETWNAGATISTPLHANVKQLVDVILPAIFARWDSEDDRTVAALFGTEMAELMSRCGPAIVEGHFPKIAEYASSVLKGESLSQDEEEDEEEEESEEESELVSSAADLVGALATVLGPDFSAEFGKFLPLLRGYYSKDRSATDRSTAVGVLGEVISGLKGSVTPYVQPLFELIYLGLSDEEPEVRSNSAFAAGHLIEQMDAQLGFDDAVKVLSALRPFFAVEESSSPAEGAAKDNAAGAVARIVLKDLNVVPLDQVLPILFNALPLKASLISRSVFLLFLSSTNDFVENTPVFKTIFHLFQSSSSDPKILSVLLSHIDHLLSVFAYVLDDTREDEIEEEIRTQLIALVAQLNTLEGVSPKLQAAGLAKFL
ncbi:armadillo-type protein [Mrakia frigida]|uniref:armadillo-type protein n=1 Tax=Mrakia frigida TaxID=29902 RepID=UPI003FCC0822